jgi:N-acetylglucosaminyldiphosphoundecaprenol N-acetyl-beta-D-mannosaminyltransferase
MPSPGAPHRRRIELCGVAIDNITMSEALERLVVLALRRTPPAYVVTPNVDHLVKLQDDPEFREIYARADLVLADGVPLIWASRLLGTPLRAKVSGSDLFVAFAPIAAARGLRLFFLGGRPGAAGHAAATLRARYRGLQVVGTYAPPFGFDRDPTEDARAAERVRAAAPDVLFVGLGAPRQEKWIVRHLERLAVPLSMGVGVSFEFVSGDVRRAPRWMQRCGLEWTWRLAMEPRRLWRRYLVEDLRFFGLVARDVARRWR